MYNSRPCVTFGYLYDAKEADENKKHPTKKIEFVYVTGMTAIHTTHSGKFVVYSFVYWGIYSMLVGTCNCLAI